MSVDEQNTSSGLGDPTARPPTPQQTPVSALFSSPLLQTPKQTSGHIDDATGWTPRFADEYYLFNPTPGDPRPTLGAFILDSAPLSPLPPSPGNQRPVPVEGVGREVSTHANHFSLNPQDLRPVDAARRLPSSTPNPVTLTHKSAVSEPNFAAKEASQQHDDQRPAKRHRPGNSPAAVSKQPSTRQTQTATPPPSSRRDRKFVPKLQTDTMQRQSFAQPDFSTVTPLQPELNTAFVTASPGDVFNYPVGPATAPAVTAPRSFWGMDMDLAPRGMTLGVDFSTAAAELFQDTSTQNLSTSDWARANEMFQQTNTVVVQPQQPPHRQPQLRSPHLQQVHQNQHENALVPPKKANTPVSDTTHSSPTQNFSLGSFPMPIEDPFNNSPAGVEPGLLFSQPASSADAQSGIMSMSIPMSIDSVSHQTTWPRHTNLSQMRACNGTQSPLSIDTTISSLKDKTSCSTSVGGHGKRKQLGHPSRGTTSSNDASGRPGLSRSLSESARGGKRTAGGGGRHSTPTMPTSSAGKPGIVLQHSRPPSLPPSVAVEQINVNKKNPAQTLGARPGGGRRSPHRSSHGRSLSGLTSIPENSDYSQASKASAKGTSVKFVIDGNGRARTETVVDCEAVHDGPSSNQQGIQHTSWTGVPVPAHDHQHSSSSDDEPIIIPSRQASVDFPDLLENPGLVAPRPHMAASSTSQARRQRADSKRASSSRSFRRNCPLDPDTSQPDQMDMDKSVQAPPRPSTGSSSLGDASAELRKVMQAGNANWPRVSRKQQQKPSIGSGESNVQRQRFPLGLRSSSSTISEASLPTPSPTQNEKRGRVRCVCNRPEVEVDGARFLIKCDSCAFLLHGRCVNVPAPDDMPHVYICAFCSNTPNLRRGRRRNTWRVGNPTDLVAGSCGGDGGDGGDGADGEEGGGGGGGPVVTRPPARARAFVSSPLAYKSSRSFRSFR